jgi:exo-beta-1,3-glucanase (GH17 family)
MGALTETLPQNVNGRPTITRRRAHWPAPSSWAHAAAQLLMGVLLLSAWACNCDAKSAADLGRLADSLAHVRFVAYTAREFAVLDGQPRAASAEGVCQDLRLLRPYFDGIITYSVRDGHEHVPALARALGFRAAVIGVWDPASAPELETAVRLARAYPDLVMAVAVGNEGLFWKRYDRGTLESALARLRAALPGLPVTTSEPFAVYLDGRFPGFLEAQDFLLPNVHPLFEPWFHPDRTEQAVEFVVEVVKRLRANSGKPVLVKETGLPSGPQAKGYSDARQAEFWRRLPTRMRSEAGQAVAWFEAFDGPWKPAAAPAELGREPEEEAHWGLLRADGTPKPVLSVAGPRKVWSEALSADCGK